jgi:hypothetical protein
MIGRQRDEVKRNLFALESIVPNAFADKGISG